MNCETFKPIKQIVNNFIFNRAQTILHFYFVLGVGGYSTQPVCKNICQVRFSYLITILSKIFAVYTRELSILGNCLYYGTVYTRELFILGNCSY